ncbi:competence/damage-inducible protein A [Flavobacteriaceae bacterium]|nr:competence/damage-inducible protein A [Flavobacteriaceae bacterium]MDA9323359.1 competence/damage-inducible protein A [Flavobacteriaceae bacterium]MDB4007506.1 competence/damage-inducible protein A [Flavobacteriaceae bacterium]MDB4024350.1 competence/damage-inducible protein A [Flavobacteriaceae bacterium]MDB4131124.1 competence/damage-inducible protein A [Flavobacteriaceae bacterium]
MSAKIITIGDEILIGQIVDTNSTFISKQLINIGIEVNEILSISDEKSSIFNALDNSLNKFDIVITTGGLGPTNDDITKEVFCEFFNDKLVHNENLLIHIENLFKKFVNNPINNLNRAQALVPSKAKLIENKFGTAAGMAMIKGNTLFISLPGVPYEMKSMITSSVLPLLSKEFECPVILKKTLMTYGVGESTIANQLKDFEQKLAKNFKLAYLPNLGRVRLRISCKGNDKKKLEYQLDLYISELYNILGKIIIGFESVNSIELEIGKILAKSNKTLSTAESFTGGLISSRISSVPGASEYFKGSVVAYDTNVKKDLLKLDEGIINDFSVVSSQVANEMANNVKKLLDSDYSISTTGNAGPTKGDSKKDIGLIYISIATPIETKSYKFNFGNNREKNIKKSVNKALELLFNELSKG